MLRLAHACMMVLLPTVLSGQKGWSLGGRAPAGVSPGMTTARLVAALGARPLASGAWVIALPRSYEELSLSHGIVFATAQTGACGVMLVKTKTLPDDFVGGSYMALRVIMEYNYGSHLVGNTVDGSDFSDATPADRLKNPDLYAAFWTPENNPERMPPRFRQVSLFPQRLNDRWVFAAEIHFDNWALCEPALGPYDPKLLLAPPTTGGPRGPATAPVKKARGPDRHE